MDLADAEIVALGGPQASGFLPRLNTSLSGKVLTIWWDPAVTGFNLESTGSLTTPSWSPVQGVTNNSVAITVVPGSQFYRLRN